MPWYDAWFGSDAYKLAYQHRDQDEAREVIDLVEGLAHPAPGAHVLDIGCGRGRHALDLARRSYAVTGLDLSEDAIADARQAAADADLDVQFVVQDMREPACDACADGAVNLFTTFGYFEDDAESQRALTAVARALKPKGWFVQDFLNPSHVADTLVPADTIEREGTRIHQRRWIEDDRVHKEIDVVQNGSRDTFRESVRLFTREDFEEMYATAGLRLQSIHGDYDGRDFAADSPRMILYARKARE